MHINNNNNNKYNSNNFTSRNATIRKADDIVRTINRKYTGFSPSMHVDYLNREQFCRLDMELNTKLATLRDICSIGSELPWEHNNQIIRILPASIKTFKIRNCGESADLACLGAKVNGINDFYKCALMSNEAGDLDHAIVVVENNGNPYIMDAWLGFADYIDKAMERYTSEYGYHFDLSKSPCEKLYAYAGIDSKYSNLLKCIPQEELQEKFPELVIGNQNKTTPMKFLKQIVNFFKKLFGIKTKHN